MDFSQWKICKDPWRMQSPRPQVVLGTAFNLRAAERQIEILKSMGCNAIRIA